MKKDRLMEPGTREREKESRRRETDKQTRQTEQTGQTGQTGQTNHY